MKRQWISTAMAIVVMATPVTSLAAAPTQPSVVKAPVTTTQKTPAKTAEVQLPAFASDFSQVYWVNDTQLIGCIEDETGSVYHLIDLQHKTTKKIINADQEVAELSVSHNGQYAAFVGKEGDLELITLATGQQMKITDNTEAKTELVWASDDSKLFYLMGEKIDQVVSYVLNDQKATTVVADKVQFKADLAVSKDGSSIAYTVTPAGKTDEAAGFTVDTKNTEPQIYFVNLKSEKPAPMVVSSGTDNKLFGQFLADGSYLYVSADTENKSNSSEIRKISSNGKENTVLFGGMYVTTLQVTAQNEVFFTGKDLVGSSNTLKLRQLDEKGIASPVATLNDEITEVYIAGSKKIAVIYDRDGKQVIGLLEGSKTMPVTQ